MGSHVGKSQTIPLCWRLRWWHGASFPSFVGTPVLFGLLEFSDWQLVQVLVEACHFFSSQAAHCHRSSGRLLITHAILFLVPLLHFHGTWIYTCVSWRFSRFLWLHRLIIELHVDGVSRECEGFIRVVFTKAIFFWIERRNLRKSVNRLFICGMSLTMNLVQNYSDQFGNS